MVPESIGRRIVLGPKDTETVARLMLGKRVEGSSHGASTSSKARDKAKEVVVEVDLARS